MAGKIVPTDAVKWNKCSKRVILFQNRQNPAIGTKYAYKERRFTALTTGMMECWESDGEQSLVISHWSLVISGCKAAWMHVDTL
jgi:hypothetical protein